MNLVPLTDFELVMLVPIRMLGPFWTIALAIIITIGAFWRGHKNERTYKNKK